MVAILINYTAKDTPVPTHSGVSPNHSASLGCLIALSSPQLVPVIYIKTGRLFRLFIRAYFIHRLTKSQNINQLRLIREDKLGVILQRCLSDFKLL